ncbi:MAG: SufD family Fe-S cluster assembly protein [Actinobacteria bacterium]|nr:SufD family Fe-S cluster assembly protein [Actinomycetota bacterium]MCL5446164.1 SufD family Fe-S cluster assembly protein [Actinomycetota bacterium]
MDKPSESEEHWRYSIIDDLDIDDLVPATTYDTAWSVIPRQHVFQPADSSATGISDVISAAEAYARKVATKLKGSYSALAVLYDGILVVFEPGVGHDAGSHVNEGKGYVYDDTTSRDSSRDLGKGDHAGSKIILHAPSEAALGFLSLFNAHEWPDALQELHDAFSPEPAILRIPDGVTLEQPVVVVNVASTIPTPTMASPAIATPTAPTPAAAASPVTPDGRTPVSFSTLGIDLGTGARASVVEIVTALPSAPDTTSTDNAPDGRDGPRSLFMPVTLVNLSDNSALNYVNIQILPQGFWQLSHLHSLLGNGAQLRSLAASLGGTYARTVTESTLAGSQSSTELLAAYLGSANQVHDMRTVQRHVAKRTASNLLFVGAAGDQARAVYSGLIKMEPGAKRSDALQTNRNLILSEGAKADSVPNLSIEENDVRCSHASSTGPVDSEMVYYLETRGVKPEDAKRLLARGFFAGIHAKNPIPETDAWLTNEIEDRMQRMEDGNA